MRLIRTQANKTLRGFRKAEALLIKAIDSGNYTPLRNQLIQLLGPIPLEALKLLQELSLYEADFTYRVMEKTSLNVPQKPTKASVLRAIETSPVSVSLDRPPMTIYNTYAAFVNKKIEEYLRIIRDSRITNALPEVTKKKIEDLTRGLITTQNLTLAGVAVIATANTTRQLVAEMNGKSVVWTAILDRRVCPFCRARHGEEYTSILTIPYRIPAHGNCRCTWLIKN